MPFGHDLGVVISGKDFNGLLARFENSGGFLFGIPLEAVPATEVNEGQEIKLAGHSFQVFHTPGHSPGSTALFHKESSSLFPGDTVFTGGGVGRWDLPGGDLKKLIASVERLRTLKAENLYVGHGPSARGDGIKEIDRAWKVLKTFSSYSL